MQYMRLKGLIWGQLTIVSDALTVKIKVKCMHPNIYACDCVK
jgi:hypothetical protein